MANQNFAKQKADDLVEKADQAAAKAAEKATAITEEIDIRAIFISIWEFIVSLFNRLVFFLITLKRIHIKYFKMLVLIGILIGGGTLAFHFLSREYYVSSMIVKSQFLQGQLIDKTIQKLDVLADDRNYEELASVLKIPITDAEQIQGFKIVPLVQNEDLLEVRRLEDKLNELLDPDDTEWLLEGRSMEDKAEYEIFVFVFDTYVWAKLEQPILNFIANRPYVKKRMEIHEQNLIKRRNKLIRETRRMDSLNAAVMRNFEAMMQRSREGNNNVILSERNLNNPLEIVKEDLQLAAEIREIDRALFLETNLELLDSFTRFVEPANPSIIFLGSVAARVIIGLFYILVILIEIGKWLSGKEQEFLEKTNNGQQLNARDETPETSNEQPTIASGTSPTVG